MITHLQELDGYKYRSDKKPVFQTNFIRLGWSCRTCCASLWLPLSPFPKILQKLSWAEKCCSQKWVAPDPPSYSHQIWRKTRSWMIWTISNHRHVGCFLQKSTQILVSSCDSRLTAWQLACKLVPFLVNLSAGKVHTQMSPKMLDWLVVFATPLKNDGVKVSWDDDIPNWMESHKSHVPNHQPVDTTSRMISSHPSNFGERGERAVASSHRPGQSASKSSSLDDVLLVCRTRVTWIVVENKDFQWECQEPKLEVPTIYKAYIRP